MNNITLDEFRDIFKYLIRNNRNLVDSGKTPITVGLCGSAGVGKTSVMRDIAQELGMTYVKLSLSELEEVADLTGMPVKEYKVIVTTEEGTEEKWVPADVLTTYSSLPCGTYEFTNESRMSYAPPAWLPKDDNPNGCLLNLDDYSRANSLFQQAIMELISTGKYISWKLPRYTVIACTSNPDDGTYSVTSLDPAQKSRLINFDVRFSLEDWGKWAENYQLDNRALNFGLTYGHELFKDVDNSMQTINPRSYVTFCNAISGIEDWSNPTSLALILNIAKGCFTDKDNIVGHLFTTFIANKLDKLISPEDMLMGKWETIKPQIKKCVYDDSGQYRPDVASVLHTRLLNYSMYYFDQKGARTEVVQDRLLELIEASENKDDMLFSEDLIFDIIRTLMKYHPNRTNKFMLNKKIRDKVK